MKKWIINLLIIYAAILLVSCKQGINEPKAEDFIQKEDDALTVNSEQSELDKKITVDLINDEGISVGNAILKEVKEGVQISIDAHHLPAGLHGFHIHEQGICEPPSFESAGGHFNPTNKKHGFDNPEGYHKGDLGNLEVHSDGTAKQNLLNKNVTLQLGKENSLLQKKGTSLIIHAEPDDYKTDPAGNAGKRIACGVIHAPEETP